MSSPSSALLLPMVSVVEHMSGVTLLPPSRQLLRTLRQSSTGWGSSHSNTRPTSFPCKTCPRRFSLRHVEWKPPVFSHCDALLRSLQRLGAVNPGTQSKRLSGSSAMDHCMK